MAELFTVCQLLAPGAVAVVLDRSRGKAFSRAALLAGIAVAAPALTDVFRAQFGMAGADRAGLLPIAWAAQAAAVVLCLALPTLVRLTRDVRDRAGIARLVRERAGIAAEWGEGD